MSSRISPIGSFVALACGLASCAAVAGPPTGALSFEDAVRQSDRIVVGTVLGVGSDTVSVPGGGEIALGIKDPASGLVFTPYRLRVDSCLYDRESPCQTGDTEVLVPGGTVYETVDGASRLRTWEVAGAAGAPLGAQGDDVLLFLKRRNGRFLPLNDRAGRIRVDRSGGAASVPLRFDSPRFLSAQGREAARARTEVGPPAMTPPEFVEAVPLDRLQDLIRLAREAPKPTSGNRHAHPSGADSHVALSGHARDVRVRPGDDADRSQASLGFGDDSDSPHGSIDGGRACGS